MRTFGRLGALVAGLAILALMASACRDAGSQTGEDVAEASAPAAGALRMGERVPDFELPALGGGTVRLNDALDGESFLVVMWYAPTCPCARHCSKAIAETITPEAYPDVRFVAVISETILDYDWFQEDLAAERDKGYLPFPVALDADQTVLRAWGTERVPTVWVTDKQGHIRFYGAPENTLEPLDPEYAFVLKEALDDLRAGRDVRTPTLDPIGCLISMAP